jgi:hypothetical protein
MARRLDIEAEVSSKGAAVTLQKPRSSGRLRMMMEGRVRFHAHVDPSNALAGCMSGPDLDDGLRAMLETNLDSFEKLEIIRALLAAGKAMSRSELEVACQIAPELIADTLPSLEGSRMIESDAANHQIRLGTASKDPRFARLMQLYEEDRIGVLAVLSSMVMRRLRSMAARAFADAFVIGKKRGDDG